MDAASRRIRARVAAPALLAVSSLLAGVGVAALLHSPVWSAPPAILGLVGYAVFSLRAVRRWHGPGTPCLHDPPCWKASAAFGPQAGAALRSARSDRPRP